MPPVITFLTDFGVTDDLVGTCHGVMKRITPEVEIIDITHGIAPLQVLQGALVLRNTLPYMPEGVHLAVVDPVWAPTARPSRCEAATAGSTSARTTGSSFPQPRSMGGIAEAWELTEPAYRLAPLSRTFHGRDVFAPAAASSRRWVVARPLSGPALDVDTLAAARRTRRRGLGRARSSPTCSSSIASATCSSTSLRATSSRWGSCRERNRARDRARAVLRRRCADVRGRGPRRHRALRGLVPEHLDRDQRR